MRTGRECDPGFKKSDACEQRAHRAMNDFGTGYDNLDFVLRAASRSIKIGTVPAGVSAKGAECAAITRRLLRRRLILRKVEEDRAFARREPRDVYLRTARNAPRADAGYCYVRRRKAGADQANTFRGGDRGT